MDDHSSWATVEWEDIESQLFTSIEEHLNVFKSRVRQHAAELRSKVEERIELMELTRDSTNHERIRHKQALQRRLELVQKLPTKIGKIVKLLEKVGVKEGDGDDDIDFADKLNLAMQRLEERQVEEADRLMEMIKQLKKESERRFEELGKALELRDKQVEVQKACIKELKNEFDFKQALKKYEEHRKQGWI